MKKFIKEILKLRAKTYSNDPILIYEDYKNELSVIGDYKGRQLFEMLQNADDETITDKNKTCLIELTEDRLIIANNGNKFSEGGIKSLLYGHISPKTKQQNKVGQKGLGFRSILSWGNKIVIKSYDFAIEFSKDNANDFLDSITKKNKNISEILTKETDDEKPIAILRCPKIVEIPKNLNDYDTYIIVDLKDGIWEKVQKQLNIEITEETLLFLNNIESIIVKSPDKNIEIKKNINNDVVQITNINSSTEKVESKQWNIKSLKGIYKKKNYELKIAWNNELTDNMGVLYSYFKTNVQFPFPALIHGTFDLTSNRNNLIEDSDYNKHLVDELIQLLIDTSIYLANDSVSYKPLKLLGFSINNSFDTFFINNNFEERLKLKIKENKIFPNCMGSYISYKDEPVFYLNDYANVLPTEDFENLLLHTKDDDVVRIINWIECYVFSKDSFFKTISTLSKSFNNRKRALLIKYIIEDFNEIDTSIELPNIFVDQNSEVIDSSLEIFLPSSGELIDIPLNLNLKIIHPELFKEIKKVFNNEKAEVIENELTFFNVKVYRFGDIFRRIIKLHNEKSNSKVAIKELLNNLYKLYSSNKDKNINIIIPTGIIIPILNRLNKKTFVSKVYLGKEYNNELCEILYSYDKSKLVATPSVLGLKNALLIKEFLMWLGVEVMPRRKIINVNSDKKYLNIVLKNFPYKNELLYSYDNTIKSFKDLSKKKYHSTKINVETIENLEDLLSNNSNENILYWVHIDSRILNRNESNNLSEIEIDLANKKYYVTIRNSNMQSYIRYKISEIQWLKSKVKPKVTPSICCLSKSIKKELSPLIEIPLINYRDKLFKDSKISQTKINQYLIALGVKKDISNFSTDTIYSMLINLYESENGIIAKMIYRELAENLDVDEIDISSKYYQKYINEGKVYSLIDGEYSFKNINEVFYVEDKTYGEDVINQFNTIIVDRRNGVKRINKIFGVKGLDYLSFKLVDDKKPILHKLNDSFQEEIATLKPYIYSFRIIKDKSESELNNVKNTTITLCTSIDTEYQVNGEVAKFNLKPYEFIYLNKRTNIFLLLDVNIEYNSLKDFSNDYKLSASIAEIFSSILKVDAHRNSFARLTESNKKKREYIIQMDLDDKELLKLKEAKRKLNFVDNPKLQFWNSIFSVLSINHRFKTYKKRKFNTLIIEKLDVDIDEFSIDYDDLNKKSNYIIYKKLFKLLNIDITDFNRDSTIELNIIAYYEDILIKKIINYQEVFENKLFVKKSNESIEEKGRFLLDIKKYKKFNQFSIKNSIEIDTNKVFYDTIRNVFGIDLNINSEGYKSVNDIYINNYKKLEESFNNLDKKILQSLIDNSIIYRSLIYFAEYKSIIKEYNSLIFEDKKSSSIILDDEKKEFANDNFESLFNLVSESSPITQIEDIDTQKPNEKSVGGKGSGGGFSSGISKVDKDKIGFVGEVIVYKSLISKYGNKNVIWESGYAQKANINPKGDDDNHYDMRYRKNKKWVYVEVKSTTTMRLDFKISKKEIEFGIEKCNKYEIFIVIDVFNNQKGRTIKKIKKPFKFKNNESFNKNNRFLVMNDSFTIKMKEK